MDSKLGTHQPAVAVQLGLHIGRRRTETSSTTTVPATAVLYPFSPLWNPTTTNEDGQEDCLCCRAVGLKSTPDHGSNSFDLFPAHIRQVMNRHLYGTPKGSPLSSLSSSPGHATTPTAGCYGANMQASRKTDTKKKKRTTSGIPRWSPTRVLV